MPAASGAGGKGPFVIAGQLKAAPTQLVRLADLDPPPAYGGVVTKGAGAARHAPPPSVRLMGGCDLIGNILDKLLDPVPGVVLLPGGGMAVATGSLTLRLARAAGVTHLECRVLDLRGPINEYGHRGIEV
jgi:hypothetical protein